MSTNGKKWMKRLNVVVMKRYIFNGISKVKGVDLGVGGGGGCWGASPYTTLLKTSRCPKEIRTASHQGPGSGEFSLRNTFSHQLKHQFRKGASFLCFLMATQK